MEQERTDFANKPLYVITFVAAQMFLFLLLIAAQKISSKITNEEIWEDIALPEIASFVQRERIEHYLEEDRVIV